MKEVEKFWDSIKNDEMVVLATADGESVTMRVVSPVPYKDSILIFTDADSTKYRQLQQNPNCSMAVGSCFLEAKAEFFGPTMNDENAAMREAYSVKFNDAFVEGVPFGGRESEFVLFHPVRLSGWVMDEGGETGSPFEHLF